MTSPIPVPVDVLELVLRELRPALAARPEPVAAGVKVSTVVSTPAAAQSGPPSLPWLLLAVDGHTWAWPAVQRAVIRLTAWHTNAHSATRLCALAVGLLCAPRPPGALLAVEPVAAPVAGLDPYTSAPLATAAVAVQARTPHP